MTDINTKLQIHKAQKTPLHLAISYSSYWKQNMKGKSWGQTETEKTCCLERNKNEYYSGLFDRNNENQKQQNDTRIL